MKRAVSILLLCMMLYNTVGYYIFFEACRWQIRQQVKEQLKVRMAPSDLVCISVKNNQAKGQPLDWVEDHEFMLAGEMFDVVYSKKRGDVIDYYCINDEQEEKLFENLQLYMDDAMSADTPEGKRIKSILKVLLDEYLPVQSVYCFFAPLFSGDTYIYPSQLLCFYISDINSPPPEIVA